MKILSSLYGGSENLWCWKTITDTIACVRVDEDPSESFPMRMGVRQRCVMSPWLLNIFYGWVYERSKPKFRM